MPVPLREGQRVRSLLSGTLGTVVWDQEDDMWGSFVPVEWDSHHSFIEDVAVEELEGV